MITVEVYSAGTEDFIATLSYSGKGKTCTIDAFDDSVKDTLEQFVDTVLSLPKRGRAYPEDRQVWMESLPIANVMVPYWFKIADNSNEIVEEEEDGYEEIDETDGGEDPDSGGDSGDSPDGGDSNGGEDGLSIHG